MGLLEEEEEEQKGRLVEDRLPKRNHSACPWPTLAERSFDAVLADRHSLATLCELADWLPVAQMVGDYNRQVSSIGFRAYVLDRRPKRAEKGLGWLLRSPTHDSARVEKVAGWFFSHHRFTIEEWQNSSFAVRARVCRLEQETNNKRCCSVRTIVEDSPLLTELTLRNAVTGDRASLEAIGRLSSLQTLNLRHFLLTNIAMQQLVTAMRSLTGLTCLDLDKCKVRIELLEQLLPLLQTNELKISSLGLSNNLFRDLGGQLLGQCLSSNTTLKSLNLCNSKIETPGLLALCQGLSTNHTLTELNLKGTKWLGDPQIAALAAVLQHNTSLQKAMLSGCKGRPTTSIGLPACGHMLAVNSTLQTVELDLYQPLELSELIAGFHINKTLTTVILHDDGHLVRHPQSQQLLEAVLSNPNLATLELAETEMEQRLIACLAEALLVNTSLTRLVLRENDANMETDVLQPLGVALQSNSTLTELQLSSSYYSQRISTMGRSLMEGLKHNQGIRSLKLHCQMQGPVLGQLAGVLLTNTVLTDLDLSSNQISGLMELAFALDANKTLRSLSLGCSSANMLTLEPFFKGLAGNQGLQHLSLRNVGDLRGQLAEWLAESLQQNSTLQSLDLHNHRMQKLDLDTVMDALASNRGLTAVDLSTSMLESYAPEEIKSWKRRLRHRELSFQVKF